MIRFIIGYLLLTGFIVVWNFGIEARLVWNSFALDTYAPWTWVERYAGMVLEVCVLPVAAATITALIVNHLRPRKMFERRLTANAKPLFCGMIAAFLAVAITGATLVYLDLPVDDPIVLIGSSILATAFVISLCAKVRPGRCLRCDYDLRSSCESARCPECELACMPD